MMRFHWRGLRRSVLAMMVVGACAPADPPTVTPGPANSPPVPDGSVPQSIVVTMAPPPNPQVPLAAIEPLAIDSVAPYRDAGELFAIDVPAGWVEDRRTATLTGDGRLGTVFQAPRNNGLLSVTQFDNGREPQSLGATANQLMRLTGIIDEPDFLEIRRQSVIDRQGEAMTVEVSYTRRNGMPMRGLMLFQIDFTTFSMVNLAVEKGSWNENEGVIRDILASYVVPRPGKLETPPAGQSDAGRPATAQPTTAQPTNPSGS